MRTLYASMACLLAGGCAHVYGLRPIESNPAAAAEEATARAYVERRAQHDVASAFALFNEGMKRAVPTDQLQKNWIGLEEAWGPFVRIEGVRAQAYGKGWAAIVVCRFASDVHTMSVYFDSEAKISGSYASNPSAAGAMFIDALGHHHPDWADALSDGQMHDVAPPERLAQIWTGLETKFGAFERVAQNTDRGLYTLVIAKFGHTFATFNVGIDARGEVTGFHVVAVGEPPTPSPNPSPRHEPQIDFDRHSGLRSTPGSSASIAQR